jgi:hypothetical protein
MRYTLRLLTAQQFQRSFSTMCAWSTFVAKHPELGKIFFYWDLVGSANNPNTRRCSLYLNQLQKSSSAENPFIIGKCPWCNARWGHYDGQLPRGVHKGLGYQQSAGTVVFKCPDQGCEFK